MARATLLATAVLPAGVAGARGQAGASAISDNSFLVEEAYNQEPGVVQHINGLLWRGRSGAWLYTFTQEWPIAGQRHQLSFTLPVERSGGPASVTGVGDVAVNYRYQLAGPPTVGRVAVAPRISLLLPTGRARSGTGAGGLGLQVSLPVSATLAPRMVAHGNAGATVTPAARNSAGDEAMTRATNLGGSLVWLARPGFNLLVEIAWTRAEEVTAPGAAAAAEELVVVPGVRWAHNFASGLQIVPGIGFPVGVGASRGEHAAFFYLSFEHPFRSASS